jgi:hypothetical protein
MSDYAMAIGKIEEMARPQIHKVGENEYVIGRGGEVTEIRPELDFAKTKELYSLDALVQMIKTEAVKLHESVIYVMAKGHDRVECFLQPNPELRQHRQLIYDVQLKDVPGWNAKDGMPFEEALIAVRTCFQQTPDTEYLLKLLSEITNKAKVTYSDNGIATSVVTQNGVALQQSVPIRPIVALRPYRTFQEIEQPASEFHIRISERGIRFIEADGGMWKLEARKTIAKYFGENLEAEIADGRVVVML